MKKITSIKVTNNYVLLNLSDKTSFKISEDDYLEYKFKANMEIDERMLGLLKTISNYHSAYMSALNKIKYKDRSEYEIRSLLYDFDLNKRDVDEIINKLKRYDFINDERYTRDLIERSQIKYYGYNKIKSELINVKINSDNIENLLIFDGEKEFDLALEYARKSLKTIRNKNKFATINTIRQKLLYRGFNNDIISNVILSIDISVSEDIEEELLRKEYEKVNRRYSRKYEGYDLRVRNFNFLYSKGYSSSLINELLDEMENSNE